MTDTPTIIDWGPLGTPIHGPVPEGRPPWKDNAYLAFWDPKREVYGAFHVSTSPNAEGRRARFSVAAGGRAAEVIEDLEPGTWSSDSIAFSGGDEITVSSDQVSATLRMAPIFALADYTAGQVIPPLIAGEPLHHYERAVELSGKVLIDGHETEFAGYGVRDRSWGYRDESVSFPEYIGFLAVFGDFAISCLRFRGAGGEDRTEGHRLAEADETERVSSISITRDASGLLARAELGLAGGGQLDFTAGTRRAGFWVPMGWTRKGPTMSAYDEFVPVSGADGAKGFALVEHGIVRQLY